MKRALLVLVIIAAIAGAFALGMNGPRFWVRDRLALNPQPSAQVSQPSALSPQPAVSDRIWTAGTEEVPVLMYHDVVKGRKDVWFDLTAREFESQMQAIKDAGGTVVPLSDVVEHLKSGKPLPPKAIALTFDDNTLGIYENAYPIMERFGYHSTQFVHTGKVGVTTVKEHCTWDQLRQMQDSGLVEIGSHTINHPPDLRALTTDQVRAELTESKATIEAEMGRPCRFFAYTEGNGSEQTAQMVADAGYEAAWNEARAWDASPCDRLFMARFAPFRLDDVLARWAGEDDRGRTVQAAADLHPDGGHVTVETEAGSLDITLSAWPALLPTPEMSSNLVGGYDVPNMMLVPYATFPYKPDLQWTWLDRPLVIATADRALVVGYQPWMGASEDALRLLLPGCEIAAIGVEQLLHDGVPCEARVWRRGRRRVTFMGWKADGTPVIGEARRMCRREPLTSALKTLGLKEAVLMGR